MSKKIETTHHKLAKAIKKHAKLAAGKKTRRGRIDAAAAEVKRAATKYAAVATARTDTESPCRALVTLASRVIAPRCGIRQAVGADIRARVRADLMRTRRVYFWRHATTVGIAANIARALPAGYNGDDDFYKRLENPPGPPPRRSFGHALTDRLTHDETRHRGITEHRHIAINSTQLTTF
jgi:hypothetical protein